MTTVPVVFDIESSPPVPIGTYIRTDEDTVIYATSAGTFSQAPVDCVIVIDVDLVYYMGGGSTAGGERIIPCTCTVACIPQGIREDQTCKLTIEPVSPSAAAIRATVERGHHEPFPVAS